MKIQPEIFEILCKNQLKLLITALFLDLSSYQNFPLKSSKWYYSNNGGDIPPNSTLSIFEYEKDTIINDTLATELNNGIIFYYHNDSVFYFNQEQQKFGLVYVFSAMTGDTIEICAPPSELSDMKTFNILIDTVVNQLHNGEILKKYHTKSLNSGFRFEHDYYSERIGAIYFLPIFGYSFPEADYLKCYEDSSIYINYSSIPCDSLVSNIHEVKRQGDYIIYTDPSNGNIEIRSNGNETVNIEIIDLAGRILYSEAFDLDRIVLNKPITESGIFLIRIRKGKSIIAIEKVFLK